MLRVLQVRREDKLVRTGTVLEKAEGSLLLRVRFDDGSVCTVPPQELSLAEQFEDVTPPPPDTQTVRRLSTLLERSCDSHHVMSFRQVMGYLHLCIKDMQEGIDYDAFPDVMRLNFPYSIEFGSLRKVFSHGKEQTGFYAAYSIKLDTQGRAFGSKSIPFCRIAGQCLSFQRSIGLLICARRSANCFDFSKATLEVIMSYLLIGQSTNTYRLTEALKIYDDWERHYAS